MHESLKWILKYQCCVLMMAVSAFAAESKSVGNRQEENRKAMATKIDESERMLNDFEKTRSIDALQGALTVLEHKGSDTASSSAKPMNRSDSVLYIKKLARMRLRILAVIERNEDKKFEASVPPPPNVVDAGGMLQPGGDPQYIKDPTARAQYAAALKKNQEDKEKWYFQFRLKRMDELITLHLGTLIPLAYRPTESDQKELDSVLQESGISEARKQKLKEVFGAGCGFRGNVTRRFGNKLPVISE